MEIAKKRSKALKDKDLRKNLDKEFQKAIRRFTISFVDINDENRQKSLPEGFQGQKHRQHQIGILKDANGQ